MRPSACLVIVAIAVLALPAQGQPVPTAPAGAAAAPSQPAGDVRPMEARIVQLSGRVQYALTDAAGQIGPWQDAKAGDLLPAGTRLRTRLRSQVVLLFGDHTVVLIDRATLASIDQFQRTADTQQVRLGLGHGAIRAGVAETTLRSDMTIETPTATLSKRGTMDFGIEYEPTSGRFRVFLAQEGLVEALNKLTDARRTVLPGQYVTQAMIRWILTATFDRHVALADLFGMTQAEKWFNAVNGSGRGSAEPGGGALAGDVGPGGGQAGAGPSGLNLGWRMPGLLTGPRAIDRPEGNFGTGGALLPRPFGQRR